MYVAIGTAMSGSRMPASSFPSASYPVAVRPIVWKTTTGAVSGVTSRVASMPCETVIMLEPVDPVFFLLVVDTEERLDVDVVVHAFNVGVRVVDQVMLDLPEKAAGAHHIQAPGHDVVQVFVA